MKYNFFVLPQLVIFTLLFLFILSTPATAQSIEPNEQIKQEMMAYLAKLETAKENSRPRISYKPATYERTSINTGAPEEDRRGSSSSAAALERRAFDILNEQRAAKGLRPLRWSEEMARVARLHSENMARRKFFSHYGPDGSTVYTRAKSLGVRNWQGMGENIAFNRGFRKPVEMACQHWMTSPGHRGNILDGRWTESGIGVAVASDGSYYFTQVFILR